MRRLTLAQKGWIGAIGLLLITEAYCAATGQQLLSEAVWDCEETAPLIPFLLGMVCGHFAWQSSRFMMEIQRGN